MGKFFHNRLFWIRWLDVVVWTWPCRDVTVSWCDVTVPWCDVTLPWCDVTITVPCQSILIGWTVNSCHVIDVGADYYVTVISKFSVWPSWNNVKLTLPSQNMWYFVGILYIFCEITRTLIENARDCREPYWACVNLYHVFISRMSVCSFSIQAKKFFLIYQSLL
jgi:hypothetical protein